MNDWTRFLTVALGNTTSAEGEATNLLKLRGAIEDGQATARMRLELLDAVEDLDLTSLLFLTPSVMRLLATRSQPVQTRTVDLIQKRYGDARPGLTRALRRLVESTDQHRLGEVLREIELLTESADSKRALSTLPFAALPQQKDAILTLSSLIGVALWARQAGDAKEARRTIRRYLTAGEHRAFRAELARWTEEGPPFVRSLGIRFIGDAEFGLSDDRGAVEELQIRYRDDRSALVSAAAIKEYSRVVTRGQAREAAEFLFAEFNGFASREPVWDIEASDDRDNCRAVHGAVLQALATVGARHLDCAQARDYLLAIVSTPADVRLDLLDAPMSTAEVRRIVRTAIALSTPRVYVRLRLEEKTQGTIGEGARVKLSAPWIAPKGTILWALAPSHGDGTLLQGTPEAVESARQTTLRAIASSLPSSRGARFVVPNTRGKVDYRQALAWEVAQRGWAMADACDALVTYCESAIDVRPASEVRPLFDRLVAIGIAAAMIGRRMIEPIPGGEAQWTALRGKVRGLFLNRLSHPRVFEWLFDADDEQFLPDDRLKLCAFLCEPATGNALVGDASERWVVANQHHLMSMGTSSRVASPLDASKCLNAVRFSQSTREACLAFEYPLPTETILRDSAARIRTAWLLTAGQLEEEWQKAVRKAEGKTHRQAIRENSQVLLQLAAEVAARGIDSQTESSSAVDLAIAYCLEVLRPEPLYESGKPLSAEPAAKKQNRARDGSQGVISNARLIELDDLSRRRLLETFATRTHWDGGHLARLFDRLIKNARTSELQFFFAIRRQHEGSEIDVRLVAHLIRMLRTSVGFSKAETKRFNSQSIRDRIARPSVVLTELSRIARKDPDVFMALVGRLREPVPTIVETNAAVALRGRLAQGPYNAGSGGDQLTAYASVDESAQSTGNDSNSGDADDGNDLSRRVADVVPVFTHYVPRRSRVRTLARVSRSRAGESGTGRGAPHSVAPLAADVLATLHSTLASGGRRKWFARVQGSEFEVPVPRPELTVDLWSLYALDKPEEMNAAIEELASVARRVRIAQDGRTASLLAARPRWTVEDLTLAVAAGQVDTVCIVKRDGDRLVVEVVRGVEARSARPPMLGTLVSLEEGDLVDARTGGALRWETVIDSLKPNHPLCGRKLTLAVQAGVADDAGTYNQIAAIGSHAATENAQAFLSCVDWDAENLAYQEMFAAGKDIEVKRASATDRSALSLVNVAAIPQGFPTPRVVGVDGFVPPGMNDLALSVSIDVGLDPYADPLVVRVRGRYRHELLLGSEQNWERQLDRLIHAPKGAVLSGRIRPDSAAGNADAKSLRVYASGLYVELDPLPGYLVSGLDPAQAVGILLTDVTTRVGRSRRADPRDDIPLDRVSSRSGIVSSIPIKQERGDRRVGVRWLRLYEDDDQNLDQERFLAELADAKVGSLITAARTEGNEFTVESRSYRGTVLHSPVSLSRAIKLAKGGIRATLLQRPEEHPADTWLFAAAPGRLLEIRREELDATALADAQTLDSVRIDGLPSTSGSGVMARAIKVSDRVALAHGARVTLRKSSHSRYGQWLIEVQPTHADLGALSIDLDDHELPASIRGRPVPAALRIDCAVESCRCVRELIGDPFDNDVEQWTVGVRLALRDYAAPSTEVYRMPSLAEALANSDPLLVRGHVVAGAGNALFARLNSYSGERDVPLPDAERSWLAYSGAAVNERQLHHMVVFGTERGAVASLRRNRPQTLDEWVSRYQKVPRLHYVGPVDEGMLALFHPPLPQPSASHWILFEIEPGVALVATNAQLHFGTNSRIGPLQAGDIVTKAWIERTGPVLHIAEVKIGLLKKVTQFHSRRGVFAARVRVVSGGLAPDGDGIHRLPILAVRGLESHADEDDDAPQGSGWAFELHATDEQVNRIRGGAGAGEVYAHYDRLDSSDANRPRLIFRMLDQSEAFIQGNLVFVRWEQTVIDGPRRQVTVSALGDEQPANLVITENRISWRNRYLDAVDDAQQRGHVLLVKCIRGTAQGPTLSLIDIPFRGLDPLYAGWDTQRALVIPLDTQQLPPGADAREDDLALELSLGVYVRAPRRLFEGLDQRLAELDPPREMAGDVVVLNRASRGADVRVGGIIPSHRRFLPAGESMHHTQLWREDTNGKWPSSIVGLPELRAIGSVRAENQVTRKYVMQMVSTARRGSFVSTSDRGVAPALVGRLSIVDERPIFTAADGTVQELHWSDVTCRQGSTTVIAKTVERWRWREIRPRARHDVPPNAIGNTDVIVAPAANGVSFTGRAMQPYPVDHLIEQFSNDRGQTQMGPTAERREFPVVSGGADRALLEVAPGRYAELPRLMLLAKHDASPRSDHPMALDLLVCGDVVQLQVVPPRDLGEAMLPNLRLTGIDPTRWRAGPDPVVVPIFSRPDPGRPSAWLGVNGVCAPMSPMLAPLAEDSVFSFARGAARERPRMLLDAFASFGSRLLVRGTVAGKTAGGGGTRYFLDVGIKLPVAGRSLADPSFVVPDGEPEVEIGALRYLRVRRLAGHDGTITEWDGSVEELNQQALTTGRRTIRYRGTDAEVAPATPRAGDSVLVIPTAFDASVCRVAGFEDFDVEWVRAAGPEDRMRLHERSRRQCLLPLLWPRWGGALWATVESSDRRQRTLRLSRRNQIAQVTPRSGTRAPGRIIMSTGDGDLLIDLLATPVVIAACDWCDGNPSAAEVDLIAGALMDRDVDVIGGENGQLIARDAHALPQASEFPAQVEIVGDEGILTRAGGRRIYVPAEGLAMAQLTADMLRTLFPERSSITLARRDGAISHVGVSGLQMEYRAILAAPDLSTPAEWRYVDDTAIALVSGRSGLIMELERNASDPAPIQGQWIQAFLKAIEPNRVVLSRSELRSSVWNVTQVNPEFGLDILVTLIPTAIEALETEIRSGSADLNAWGMKWRHLEPGPRNLRLILECLGRHGAWQLVDALTAVADLAPMARTLTQVAAILRDGPKASAPAIVSFAAGYLLLINGHGAEALPFLQHSLREEAFAQDFDVAFATTYATFASGARARAVSMAAMTCARLWANAAESLSLPLPSRPVSGPEDVAGAEVARAEFSGDLAAVRGLYATIQYGEPEGSDVRFARIWDRLVAAQVGAAPLDHTFGVTAEDFLAEVEDESLSGRATKSRWHALAARLCMMCGDVGRGWWHLMKCETNPDRISAVTTARFWKTWLAGTSASDDEGNELLSSLAQLQDLARSGSPNEEFDQALERCWQVFRRSDHRWKMPLPAASIVLRAPAQASDRARA